MVTDKAKMNWLNAHGTFIALPYDNDITGNCWLEGRWISRNGTQRHKSIGPVNMMGKKDKEKLAAEVYDMVKQCLYETTMVMLS